MSRKLSALLSLSMLIGCPLAGVARAEAPAPTTRPSITRPAAPHDAADEPAIKGKDEPSNGFLKRHEGFLKELKEKDGKVGLLFVGDSITDGWRGRGKDTFAKSYAKDEPFNIGIGGDRTQHVIWRLEHGEVDGINPKVAVLMIGTNNLGGNSNDEIVKGVTKVVTTLHDKLPHTKVLLLGIFPRGNKAEDPNRSRIKAINEELAKLDDDGKTVKYLDIGAKFLTDDGTLTKDIMPDFLHPNDKGYQIWADATQATLDEMMK